MIVGIFPSPETASRSLAAEIAALIRARTAEDRPVVLGLATGKTPLFFYEELIRLHREEGLSFAKVITFNLDEYQGLGRGDERGYRSFMQDHLFSHLDILPENTHLPRGDLPDAEIPSACADYEARIREAGGIDFQILGIGRTGHIGFNEPGSGRHSRTRLVHLDELTRADAAVSFGGLESVPISAITMGCGTILEARKIALLAWGGSKASIIAAAIEGEVKDEVPASYLQDHPQVAVYLDEAAASALAGNSTSAEKHPVLRD